MRDHMSKWHRLVRNNTSLGGELHFSINIGILHWGFNNPSAASMLNSLEPSGPPFLIWLREPKVVLCLVETEEKGTKFGKHRQRLIIAA